MFKRTEGSKCDLFEVFCILDPTFWTLQCYIYLETHFRKTTSKIKPIRHKTRYYKVKIIVYVHYWTFALDMSKAFDRVNHLETIEFLA